MPLAVVQGRFGWEFVAVCGAQLHQNVWIHQGNWMARYTPAFLMHYPFVAAEDVDGQTGLAFDLQSSLLGGEWDGIPFFAPSYDLVGKTAKRYEAIRPYIALRREMKELLDILSDAEAITSWPAEGQYPFDMDFPKLYTLDYEVVKSMNLSLSLMKNAEPLARSMQQSLNRLPRLAALVGRQPL